MKDYYTFSKDRIGHETYCNMEIVETDIDLYYHMALSLYEELARGKEKGQNVTCILPVGPVFQYRRLIGLLKRQPIDLSHWHIFFMDEYLDEDGRLISEKSPLSFRGFIKKELIDPMPEEMGLQSDQIHFPDPDHPGEFDQKIEDLGGLGFCHAGVGIVGHLAFNEPMPEDQISPWDYRNLPTRVVKLTRETITINSNTVMFGAYDEIPEYAVTVGMKQILSAEKLRIYFNRPWQRAVWRKALFMDPTPEFPVTLARDHRDLLYIMTEDVAEPLDFALR